jgi:hypothetical protein
VRHKPLPSQKFIEIADVRTKNRLTAVVQGDGNLLLAADREDLLRNSIEKVEPHRREAARRSNCYGAAGYHSHDAIVNRSADRPVMMQKAIGNVRQSGLCIGLVPCQWLPVAIAASCD